MNNHAGPSWLTHLQSPISRGTEKGNGMKCGISERTVQLRIALAHVPSRNETLRRSATSCAFANLEYEPPRVCSSKSPTRFRLQSYKAHMKKLVDLPTSANE